MLEKPHQVAVIGSGSWGTALGNTLADVGHSVTIWGRDAELVRQIREENENKKYLKGITLNTKLSATTDLKSAVSNAEIIVCSIPTQQIRAVFKPIAGLLEGKLIINSSKGLEIGTDYRVSQIFKEIAPKAKYAILSGPSFALEVVRRLPTAVTVASEDKETALSIQRMFATPYFRAYTSNDVIGVEFAGALKNVVAVASGIVSGLQLGYNAQAALINRGIAEMMRAGIKAGAQPMTYLGLSGTGDLLLTCTGPLSRNRKFGILLGEGKKIAEAQKELGGVAEGYFTAKSAYEYAQRNQIDMPITTQIFQILYEGSTPQKALLELMGRELKEEWSFPGGK